MDITIHNNDCIQVMPRLLKESVDLTLTDIPYGVVNRDGNGLRALDKKNADTLSFDLNIFLDEVYRITKGTIIIFCAKEQLSNIYGYFARLQAEKKGTVRQLIWEKTNPSPMNGQYIYLSGIENAVWFKKRGSAFNAHCKNTVFRYPCGKSKIHPTEKNHKLLEELIIDNSNEGDLVFDPCMGGGSTGIASINTSRRFIGIEIDPDYCRIAAERITKLNQN